MVLCGLQVVPLWLWAGCCCPAAERSRSYYGRTGDFLGSLQGLLGNPGGWGLLAVMGIHPQLLGLGSVGHPLRQLGNEKGRCFAVISLWVLHVMLGWNLK